MIVNILKPFQVYYSIDYLRLLIFLLWIYVLEKISKFILRGINI